MVLAEWRAKYQKVPLVLRGGNVHKKMNNQASDVALSLSCFLCRSAALEHMHTKHTAKTRKTAAFQ